MLFNLESIMLNKAWVKYDLFLWDVYCHLCFLIPVSEQETDELKGQ